MQTATPGAFISQRDYNGFGVSSSDEVAALKKALSAGQDVNAPAVAPGVGFPLRTESLESTLKNVDRRPCVAKRKCNRVNVMRITGAKESLRANGEAPVSNGAGEVIPCQVAMGSSVAKGVETRRMSPNNKSAQERPTSLVDGDIVRHPSESRGAGPNSPHNRCTFEMDEIKLFRTIPKVPATNTVEEFNRLLAYSRGGARAFDLGWMTEGDLPEEEDSTYERIPVLIKFLGVDTGALAA